MKRILLICLSVLLLSMTAQARKQKDFSVLYWNVQNGMWSDQGNNYDNFVKWVKKHDPDVCVWAECKSLYVTGTEERLEPEERYLPDNWDKLAARYGHKYVYMAMHRDNYPQVLTSKHPIKGMAQIGGDPSEVVVAHGAGWIQVEVGGKVINVVSFHAYPMKYKYGTPVEQRAASAARHEGDAYKAAEAKYVCDHTIFTSEHPDNEYWIMCGDFNSKSRNDNHFYKLADDDPTFQCQDYMNNHTPYIDVIARLNPGVFCTTNRGSGRPDYMFCTQPVYEALVKAFVVNEKWTLPKKVEGTGFWAPSDHRPIYLEFKL